MILDSISLEDIESSTVKNVQTTIGYFKKEFYIGEGLP